MSINPLSALVGTTSSNPLSSLMSSQDTLPNQGLGKDAFLKLMITEMQMQDPTSPVDSKQFLSQLAQYSSLEQMVSLKQSIEQMVFMQNTGSAVSMIGKTVSYRGADGNIVAGMVSQVSLLDGSPKLLVNDQAVEMQNIITIM